MTYLEKLKTKWQITSNWQLLVICVVFAITGSASAWVSGPLMKVLGISKDMGPALFWPLRLILVFPIYQILLIIIGTVFGQYKFFWAFEKKMLKRLGLNMGDRQKETH
jgi:hypothetical protein